MSKKGGFTLVELLITIAIISILTSITLLAAIPAKNKADNTRVRNDIAQLRWQAEVVYNAQGGSFVDWSVHPDVTDQVDIITDDIDDALDQLGATVFGTATVQDYCASAPLKTDPVTHYCIDSKAVFKVVSSPCPTSGQPICPSS